MEIGSDLGWCACLLADFNIPPYQYQPEHPWWWSMRWVLLIVAIRGIFWVGNQLTKGNASPPKPDASSPREPREQQKPRPARKSEARVVAAVPVVVAESAAPASNGLLVGGYICAVVALMLFPPLFGLAGIVCGVLTIKRQQVNQGVTLLIVSFICTIIGMCIGAAS